MEKFYSVKEVSRLTGLDRKRINDYKDVIKSDHYSGKGGRYESSNGNEVETYKEYNEKSVEKFVIVSMLTELNIKRERIKEIISSSNYDSDKVLQEVITSAEKQIRRLENIVLVSKQLRNFGIEDSKYNLFCINNVDDLANMIREQMNTPYYKQAESIFDKLSENETNRLFNIVFDLGKLKNYDVTSSKVDKKIIAIEKLIIDKYQIEGDKFLVNMAFNFVGNGPLSKIVNKKYGDDASEFIFISLLAHYFKSVIEKFENLFNDDVEIPDDDGESYFCKASYSILEDVYARLKDYVGNSAKDVMLSIPKQIELVILGDKSNNLEEDKMMYNLFIKTVNKFNENNFREE